MIRVNTNAQRYRARLRHEHFIQYIKQRIFVDRMDAIIVVIGVKGSAKSSVVYDIAKKVDPLFTIERNEIYDADTYLDFIDSAPPPATSPILDDLATAADKTRWYEDFNRIVARIGQFGGSFRYLNFFVAPDIRQHLTDIKALANFVITTYPEPKDRGLYTVRQAVMSQNLTHPYIMYPYFSRAITQDGIRQTIEFNPCLAPKPSDEEYLAYEIHKEAFTRGVITKLRKERKSKRMTKETGAKEIDLERQVTYF